MSEEEKKKKVKKPKSAARKAIEWILTGIFGALFLVLGFAQIDGMVHKKDHYGQLVRFGFSNYVVKTDSMEPDYKVESANIAYLEDVDKIYKRFVNGETINATFWDVYTVENEFTRPLNHPELTKRTDPASPGFNAPMTHQVKEIHVNTALKKGQGRYTFITAGINTRSVYMGWKEGDPDLTINQYQVFTEKELLGIVIVNSNFLGAVFNFVGSPFGLLALLLVPALYLIITSVIDIFKAYKDPDEEVTEGAPNPNKGNLDLSEEDKKRLKEELLEEMLNKKKGE